MALARGGQRLVPITPVAIGGEFLTNWALGTGLGCDLNRDTAESVKG